MSKNPDATAPSPQRPGYQNSKEEERARWRRRDHANIEAVQNLAVARIAGQTGVEMPPNVRHLLSALQGAHGGGEVAFEPFSRDYLSIGRQLQFAGTEEAVRQRVRRWVDDLLGWQTGTGFELFSVVKGGEITGQRPDGTPIRRATTFIDNLKPHADDAVQRARRSETWRGNAQKGIRPHPGRAIEAEVEALLKALPRIKPEPDGGDSGEKKQSGKMSAGEYEQKREDAILRAIEESADGVEERDGDADLWLGKIEKAVRRMRDSRRRTAPARRSWIMLDEGEDEPTEAPASGNTNTGITPGPRRAPEAARLGEFIVGGAGLALGLAALALAIMLSKRVKQLEKMLQILSASKHPKPQPAIEDLRPQTARSHATSDDGAQAPLDGAETGDLDPLDALPPEIAQRFQELESKMKEIEEHLAGGEEEEDARADTFSVNRTTVVGDETDESLACRLPRSVTVEKMVAWANGAGLRLEPVKATFGLFGNFTRSEEGDNWLVSSAGTRESYLFPRVNRFESASHFRSAYNDYYDCAQPSAGTVIVEQPALVSSDPQGGWKLKDKGRLSVAS